MAHLAKNSPLQGLTGRVGTLIFKFYPKLNNGKGKTVVTKVPDMSGIKPSPLQKLRREVFAEAVAYARNLKRDPEKRAAYKKVKKQGQSVNNAAVSSYLKKQNAEMKSKGKE
jgi:GrpB-like predicted nucleotidyltransferase (UPF0157 family)